MSEDPIGLLGGDNNLFRYARGNSINNTDPFGLVTEQCTIYFEVNGDKYPHVFTCVDGSCSGFGPASPVDASFDGLGRVVPGKITDNSAYKPSASCKEQKPSSSDKQKCFDSCNQAAFEQIAPNYQGFGQRAPNCERWSTLNIQACYVKCSK
ncbi:MAG: hypothetical protein A2577_08930 [Bdellovibrionales bacterium RIFOXYD1_FULL_36_51]|nr:MAG: hypothetical protein A2577_08930 [Bdellovibrionales bacterium RIFOXYD1_FULL_36_51]